ncbi:hypothetical protein DVH05_010056 [Phytophthora capsici]|nr:hypothetical protein DVH05_010056 [Phytophthora capsici]
MITTALGNPPNMTLTNTTQVPSGVQTLDESSLAQEKAFAAKKKENSKRRFNDKYFYCKKHFKCKKKCGVADNEATPRGFIHTQSGRTAN